MSNKNSKHAQAARLLACSIWLATMAVPVAMAEPEPSFTAEVTEEQINSKPYQVSRMLVKAKPEQIWQILTDYNTAPKIFSSLKKCQVIADRGSTKVVHYQIRPSGTMTSFQYDLEVQEIGHKYMQWKRLNGDFKDVDGFWKLEPAESGRATLVTYANYVNGGLFLPQVLIKRQSHIDFPQIMSALKEHAETNTQIAASHAPRNNN